MRPGDTDRLSASIDATGDCWIWTGAIHHSGYGHTQMAGLTRMAHRAVYEWLVGPIPDGLVLDHLCRVRSCVNPDHLEPVTQAVNVRRSTFTRPLRSHCLRGHRFDEANTYWGKGKRTCRACNRAAVSRYKARLVNRA